jgi:hypothetical protein
VLKIQKHYEKPGFGRKNQLRTWMSSHLGQRHKPHQYILTKKFENMNHDILWGGQLFLKNSYVSW